MSAPQLRFKDDTGRDFAAWEHRLLGDVATFTKGKGLSKADIDENGETPCIRYGELYTVYGATIFDVKSKTKVNVANLVLSKANDVIIPASGETQIDIATASCVQLPGVALGGDLNIIRSKLDGVFLSYYLNSQKKLDIAKLAQGNSVVHLYSSQLKQLELKVPSSTEQTKIASFLTAVDEKLAKLTRKHDLLTQYKKGVMQQIFSQELRFKDDDGQGFPEWEEMSLADVGEIITGKTPSTADSSLWDGDIQFVTPTDIKDQKYQHETQRKVTLNTKLKVLPKNSIMFTCIASIGKMSLSVSPCITNQQINALITKVGFENEYIYYALLNITDFIKSTQANTTLPIINKTEFSKFVISVPVFAEQTKIAAFLTAIDDKIDTNRSQLAAAKQYKQGLLQQLFV